MINVNLTHTMSIYLYSCIDFIVLEYSNTVSTKICHTHNVHLIDQLSYHRTPYITANFTEQYSYKIAKREKFSNIFLLLFFLFYRTVHMLPWTILNFIMSFYCQIHQESGTLQQHIRRHLVSCSPPCIIRQNLICKRTHSEVHGCLYNITISLEKSSELYIFLNNITIFHRKTWRTLHLSAYYVISVTQFDAVCIILNDVQCMPIDEYWKWAAHKYVNTNTILRCFIWTIDIGNVALNV